MPMRKSPNGFFGAFGTATLVAGTVAGIALPFNSEPDKCTIILSRNTPAGTLGFLAAPESARGAAATTFTIISTNGAETSTVNWLAIPKNIGLGTSTTFVNNASARRPPSGVQINRGIATLVAGTVTVTSTVPFSDQAKIFVCARTFGGTSGKLSAPSASVNPATGQFVINSDQAADVSVVSWLILDEALQFPASGDRIGQSKGALNGSTTFSGMNPLWDTAALAPLVFAAASVINPNNPANLSADPATLDGSLTVGNSGADVSLVETLVL